MSSEVETARSAEIAVPAPASVAVPASKVDDGEVMIAVTIGVIVLIGALVLFAVDDEGEATDDGWTDTTGFTSLLEPEGFDGLVQNAQESLGSTAVTEMRLTDGTASGSVVIDDALYQTSYDAATGEWSTPRRIEGEREFPVVFDLATLESNALSAHVDDEVVDGASYSDVYVTIGGEDVPDGGCYRVESVDTPVDWEPDEYSCDGEALD